MGHLFAELRRRRVLPTVSIYVVAAWLLIQIADVLFPGAGIPEENIRYVLFTAIACFPIACIVGWKYDITTRGIKRTATSEQEAHGEADLSLCKADHALLTVLSLLTLSIVAGFGWKILGSRGTIIEPIAVLPNSVAILPLINLSEESDSEYFSAGLSDQLINVLGQIRGFRVTPSISANYFKDRELDLEDIKAKLLVANVITGSVQKAANRVRISLALTSTSEGTNLWSQSYDRDLDDIFAIQSEIAHAVAEVMKVQILGHEEQRLETAPTNNAEAYDMLMLSRQAQGFERGVELVDRAIELDPGYAEAYLLKAFFYLGAFGSGHGIKIDELLDICKTSLAKAEELLQDAAETSHEYNWVKGMCLRRTLWMGRGNLDMEREMEAAFKKAVEINPSNTTPHISYAIYLRRENRIREAENQIRQALDLDRLYQGAMYHLARVLSIQGKDDQAIEVNKRIIEYFDNGFGSLAGRYADLGRYDTAIETLLQAPDLEERVYGGAGNLRHYMIRYLAALRDYETAKRYGEAAPDYRADVADAEEASQGNPFELARAGKYEQAYEILADEMEKSGATAWYRLNEPAEMALYAGRFDDAIFWYEKGLPSLTDPIRPDVGKNIVSEALGLAYALQMTGETARAAVLFGRILDILDGRRRVGMENIGVMDACVYASLGETEKALAAFRAAIDAGWRGLYHNWMMEQPIYLDSLVGNPEFDAMVKEIDDDLAAQLKRIHEII